MVVGTKRNLEGKTWKKVCRDEVGTGCMGACGALNMGRMIFFLQMGSFFWWKTMKEMK